MNIFKSSWIVSSCLILLNCLCYFCQTVQDLLSFTTISELILMWSFKQIQMFFWQRICRHFYLMVIALPHPSLSFAYNLVGPIVNHQSLRLGTVLTLLKFLLPTKCYTLTLLPSPFLFLVSDTWTFISPLYLLKATLTYCVCSVSSRPCSARLYSLWNTVLSILQWEKCYSCENVFQ